MIHKPKRIETTGRKIATVLKPGDRLQVHHPSSGETIVLRVDELTPEAACFFLETSAGAIISAPRGFSVH